MKNFVVEGLWLRDSLTIRKMVCTGYLLLPYIYKPEFDDIMKYADELFWLQA